jgi:hypothetical protein
MVIFELIFDIEMQLISGQSQKGGILKEWL